MNIASAEWADTDTDPTALRCFARKSLRATGLRKPESPNTGALGENAVLVTASSRLAGTRNQL